MRQSGGRVQGRFAPGLFLASALIALSSSAFALNPSLQVSQYSHTSWTAREGANLGIVFGIAQTPDGYLWIAASFGLFRFDGLRFVRWQPPNNQSLPGYPYALEVTRDGTLWIGTYNGLASWDGRTFIRQYPEFDRSFVTSLLESRDGTLWVGVLATAPLPGRLCSIRQGGVQCSVPEQADFGGFVWSLAEDNAGSLWVGADSGIWRWRPGPPKHYPMPGLRVGDLSTTDDGQILAGVIGGGLYQLSGNRFVAHPLARADAPGQTMSGREIQSNKLLRDRNGSLWIGTEGLGLLHVADGAVDPFTRTDGLSGNIAGTLFEDREGNIWFGSHKGLDRFARLPVSTLSTRQGLPHELTKAVLAAADGSVWVATIDGLARWRDGRMAVYKVREGLPSARVQALYQDTTGRLWVSTAGGLAYLAGERFVAVDGGPNAEVFTITGDAEGNLWLAGDQGLTHLHRGRLVDTVPWARFGRNQAAKVVLADRGGLWLAFWNHTGVSYVKDGQVLETYNAERGLGGDHVADLRLDADGAVWAATGAGGLSRIKAGRVANLSTANGLPCNAIHWSTLDDTGALWIYTICGLVRVAGADLAAWIDEPGRRVATTLWSGADGVPLQLNAPGYFNPAVTKTRDGRIWFAGVAELQVFDPADMQSNPVPPAVHIEALVAGHQIYPAAPGLRLPPQVRDVAIEFAALTLVNPTSTRFRYRLDGHDTEWQESVNLRQATYTNLPPGNYRFRVKAANNSGVWNEDGAQLDFSILPAFYQTTWFHLLAAGLLIGLAWSGFQLRMHLRIQRLRQQFEATLEARVAERTRIARDLHDTLLQSFHGMLLQFQAAFNLLPGRPDDSKRILAGAIDQAAHAITEGRNTVQGLRASVVETSDLALALQALAEELATLCGHATSAQVHVAGAPQALHPVVRDETFSIAGEALRNAFRHADARRIDVDVRYDAGRLLVQVRDDGKGIDPDVLRSGTKEGHFGLSGMHERAELVGGHLTIGPGAAGGTEVSFSVPAARAYSRPSAGRSWFFHKWFASNGGGE